MYQWNCWAVCFRAANTQSCFVSLWLRWTMRVISSVVLFWSAWLTCSAGSHCPQVLHPPCWHPFSTSHVLVAIYGQRPRRERSSPPLLTDRSTLGLCQRQTGRVETDSRVRSIRRIVLVSACLPWPVSMNWCQRTACQWTLRSTCFECSSRRSFFCRGWRERTMLIQSRAAYRNSMRGMPQCRSRLCFCIKFENVGVLSQINWVYLVLL